MLLVPGIPFAQSIVIVAIISCSVALEWSLLGLTLYSRRLSKHPREPCVEERTHMGTVCWDAERQEHPP